MKRYTFTVVIDEGQDEFWRSIEHIQGGQEVKKALVDAVESLGYYSVGENVKVTLKDVKHIQGRLFYPRRKSASKKGKRK